MSRPSRPLSTGLRATAVLAAVVATVAVWVAPASAATGPGTAAYVSTRVDDPTDLLGRAGNVHMVSVGADVNPEGPVVSGEVRSYDCEPGQLLGDCDRVAFHRLVAAGPVSVTVAADGSAQLSATVAEVRDRDGRRLRVFDVDLEVSPGNLTLRQNCICTFTGADGVTYVQEKFVKQWTSATASGSIGVFPVVSGASSPATSSKYWVRTSGLFVG